MKLSIIIVSYNVAALLTACLRSLEAACAGTPYEVIVVDNASSDGSAEIVAGEFPTIRLIRNSTNGGFARANNQGIAACSGEYVLLLNSDTEAPPGTLARLLAFLAQRPEAGAAGPRLLQTDGKPQPFAFGGDPTPGYLLARGFNRLVLRRYLHDWATNEIQVCDWVSGACMLVRRKTIEHVGPLDEKIFMYFEDADWCLRMRRAGWRVYYDPQVAITHIGGQSVRQNPGAQSAYRESLRYFYGKHYGRTARALLEFGLIGYNLLKRIGWSDRGARTRCAN